MIKFVALLKRQPGLSLEEFTQLYEDEQVGHAAFAAPHLIDARHYERRFIKPYGNPVDGQLHEPDYDVITEIWFDNEEALDQAMKGHIAQPDIAAAFAVDEARLFDRERTRVFVVVEEVSTPLSQGI